MKTLFRTLPLMAAWLLLAASAAKSQIVITPHTICCGTTQAVTICDNCSSVWKLKIGNGAWETIRKKGCVKRNVTCPDNACPTTVSIQTQSQTFGCPSGGGTIKCVKCDQNGNVVATTNTSLAAIAADPSGSTLTLTTEDVVSYSESIDLGVCPTTSPELIALDAVISFGDLPDEELISFNIDGLAQTLGSFDVCGIPTGTNNSVVDTSEPAFGVIDVTTGEIVGSATVIHSNDLMPDGMAIPNLVTGHWDTDTGLVTLQFSGPAAAPQDEPVPQPLPTATDATAGETP